MTTEAYVSVICSVRVDNCSIGGPEHIPKHLTTSWMMSLQPLMPICVCVCVSVCGWVCVCVWEKVGHSDFAIVAFYIFWKNLAKKAIWLIVCAGPCTVTPHCRSHFTLCTLEHAPLTYQIWIRACPPHPHPIPTLHPCLAFTNVWQIVVENLVGVASVCICHIRNKHIIERCFCFFLPAIWAVNFDILYRKKPFSVCEGFLR